MKPHHWLLFFMAAIVCGYAIEIGQNALQRMELADHTVYKNNLGEGCIAGKADRCNR